MKIKASYILIGLVIVGFTLLIINRNVKPELENEIVVGDNNFVSVTAPNNIQSSFSETESEFDINKTQIAHEATSNNECSNNLDKIIIHQGVTDPPLLEPNPIQPVEDTLEVKDYPKTNWEERLYQASLKFIAETPEKANQVAKSIGYLNGIHESASNVCGPLSIAIMKEAGFFSSLTNVKPSWLLCAQERDDCNGINTLKRVFFPPMSYDYFLFNENIRNYDFNENPLQPGDFIFLLSNDTGYDHMIVVTRVDNEGAAYSVTNADRGDGFKIKEELLYHPTLAQEGFFYEFTDRSRGMLGMTGNGGMILIRRREGLESLPKLTGQLEHKLNQNVRWSILVKEIGQSQTLFENYPNLSFHPASMIKIPVAMVTMDILEKLGIFTDDFNKKGFDGRTFEQLFYAMIVNSEEDATEVLTNFIQNNGGEKKVLETWKLNDTSFLPRRTTAYDLANLLEGLYGDQFIHPDMREYLLALLAVFTENDTQYLGKVTLNLENSTLYNKRGLLLSPTIVGDMGILTTIDKAYVIIISGTPERFGVVTYEEMKASIEDFAEALGQILLSLATEN